MNCGVLSRIAKFPAEGMPHEGWKGWGLEEGGEVPQKQQQLSGQSREKDPGLRTPALSLDLHGNHHQGAAAEGMAELAACRRGRHLLPWLFCWGKDSGLGS